MFWEGLIGDIVFTIDVGFVVDFVGKKKIGLQLFF